MNVNPITILPVLPLGLIGLLFCLGLVLTFAHYRAIRDRVGNNRGLTLSILRLTTLSLLVVFRSQASSSFTTFFFQQKLALIAGADY